MSSLSERVTQLEVENQSLRQQLTAFVTGNESNEDEFKGITKSSLNAIFEEDNEGLTDAQLAKTLGVNQSTVSRWRKGKNKPSGDYEDIFDEWEVKGDRWYRVTQSMGE